MAFTPERRRTLRAVVARILPGTEGPGAEQTNVAVGFERAMQHDACRGLRPGVEAFLDYLETRSQQLHGTEFRGCAHEVQDDLLRAIERSPDPGARLLFRVLIAFSLEGFLGDPVHGGNRDCLGWEFAGLRPADVRSGFCLAMRER
jgi:gluconate 2-dehydrogenase gamma chain